MLVGRFERTIGMSRRRSPLAPLCGRPGRWRGCWPNAFKRSAHTGMRRERKRRNQSIVDQPTNLDAHRGMSAQKATDLRRLRSEVEADQEELRARQAALEDMLAAAPATDWPEAVEKARYLLGLFARSADAADPRRRKLIDQVIADFDYLLDRATRD